MSSAFFQRLKDFVINIKVLVCEVGKSEIVLLGH